MALTRTSSKLVGITISLEAASHATRNDVVERLRALPAKRPCAVKSRSLVHELGEAVWGRRSWDSPRWYKLVECVLSDARTTCRETTDVVSVAMAPHSHTVVVAPSAWNSALWPDAAANNI